MNSNQLVHSADGPRAVIKHTGHDEFLTKLFRRLYPNLEVSIVGSQTTALLEITIWHHGESRPRVRGEMYRHNFANGNLLTGLVLVIETLVHGSDGQLPPFLRHYLKNA